MVDYLKQNKAEAPAVIEGKRPPADWPAQGGIEVSRLRIQYRPELPPVLHDLSLRVKARHKVCILIVSVISTEQSAAVYFVPKLLQWTLSTSYAMSALSECSAIDCLWLAVAPVISDADISVAALHRLVSQAGQAVARAPW